MVREKEGEKGGSNLFNRLDLAYPPRCARCARRWLYGAGSTKREEGEGRGKKKKGRKGKVRRESYAALLLSASLFYGWLGYAYRGRIGRDGKNEGKRGGRKKEGREIRRNHLPRPICTSEPRTSHHRGDEQ